MTKLNDEELRKLIVERFVKPHHHQKEWSQIQKTKVHDLYSATCSDRLELIYDIDNKRLKNIFFGGSACAIATASADLLIDRLEGMTIEESKQFLQAYENLIHEGKITENSSLGDLLAFKNVHHQKNRQICATLLSDFLLKKIDEIQKNEH